METLSLFTDKGCHACKMHKPLTEFHKDKTSRDGRCDRCKSCVREYQEHLRANPADPAKDKTIKRCPGCGITKPRTDFGMRSSGRFKRAFCRACEIIKTGEWQKSNPEKVHEHNRRTGLRRHYGLTPEEYDAPLVAQGGVCAICDTTEAGGRKKHLCVDHDHKSGAIRGLLCASCNAAVGYFRNDAGRAGKMIDYLKSHNETPAELLKFAKLQSRH